MRVPSTVPVSTLPDNERVTVSEVIVPPGPVHTMPVNMPNGA